MQRSNEEAQPQQPQLISPGWLTAGITIILLIVSMAMQWGKFASTEYVDERVGTVRETENAHYIELLKSMNEIKVIVQDKQDRQDRKDGKP
jgi:hypothetical protein